MMTIMTSSSEIRNRPIDMPARSGMLTTSHGSPRSEANAVRELAQVLTRMPYQATQYEPPMPTMEKSSTRINLTTGLIGSDRAASRLRRRVAKAQQVIGDRNRDQHEQHEQELAPAGSGRSCRSGR